MGWGKPAAALKRPPTNVYTHVPVEPDPVDWDRLVTLDFETYYDDDYTLKKLSTSEYIRDPRFKSQMVGIKIGNKATKIYPAAKVRAALQAIPWQTHSLLCHHTQFDGFIMSHHYGIHPKKNYCTMSMARGLYSSEIGAGLDEVSKFCGGPGKIEGALDPTRGVRDWPKPLVASVGVYCTRDVEECLRCFKHMWPMMPRDEMDLIDVTIRMFTDPVLTLDRPRAHAEMLREIAAKRTLMLAVAEKATDIKLSKAELEALGPARTEEDILVRRAKKLIGSNGYAQLLVDEGIDPPMKVSDAWKKAPKETRDDDKKWTYAFAKTDLAFLALQAHPNERVRDLVEARLAVKSNSNMTRAGRLLAATENGWPLPVYLKYAAALTLRWGGGDKMNFQNLKRKGELRRSIRAPKGHVIVVKDSGQIEARTNAWFWDQYDLLDEFRDSDAGIDKDPYCKFADVIYGRNITKADDEERFVGKVGVLMLGYQAGAERFQNTLALGTMGKPVHLELEHCKRIVAAYRRKNHRVKAGWATCQMIIEQMADGIEGSYKCISWAKDVLYLPNGMTLKYPDLHDKKKVARMATFLTGEPAEDEEYADGEQWRADLPNYVYTRKDQESSIYGGLLCENIIQCLARLIVGKQLLEISRKERLVMTTHDEGGAVVPAKRADKAAAFMQAEMMKPLPWCMDLPLNADGGYAEYYSK